MLVTIRSNWALLVGIGLLMLGHGLQGTLLGVRAVIENFSSATTGIVMSGYSLGFLASAVITQKLVRHVGHVRVFAALASVASSAILLHSVQAEPFTWFILRFITGFCMSGVYVIAESWLNASTDNQHRGQLLSIYMVVQLSAWACGQLLLNLDDPASFGLFIIVSVLVSLAVVPLLLSAVPTPVVSAPSKFSLGDLYHTSPLGCIGMVAVGVSQGSFYSMAAVFARNIGFTVADISMMLAVATFGGMLLQWPIGQLSDKLDRRTVLTVVTLVASLALALALLLGLDDPLSLSVAFFVYGGMCLPMYALCIAHTNDYLDSDQMIGASSTLVFASGLGMVAGPLIVGQLMSVLTPFAFLAFISIVHGALGLFAIYRSRVRSSVPLDAQGQYVYIPTAAPTVMVTSIAQEEAAEQLDS
ncbi:MAG: MFS transporter [Geminicoccaceae bacterium]|nr:MFS transporter [Geminicoccaceae bacterium]MCB9943346.1 MFS transporter [Geminicoccaceae bacterium]